MLALIAVLLMQGAAGTPNSEDGFEQTYDAIIDFADEIEDGRAYWDYSVCYQVIRRDYPEYLFPYFGAVIDTVRPDEIFQISEADLLAFVELIPEDLQSSTDFQAYVVERSIADGLTPRRCKYTLIPQPSALRDVADQVEYRIQALSGEVDLEAEFRAAYGQYLQLLLQNPNGDELVALEACNTSRYSSSPRRTQAVEDVAINWREIEQSGVLPQIAFSKFRFVRDLMNDETLRAEMLREEVPTLSYEMCLGVWESFQMNE